MLKKILLGLSITAFAIGFSDIGTASQWGLGLPMGAVLLALSFIVMVLEKEMALYDTQENQKSTTPQPVTTAPTAKRPALQTS